MRGRPRQCRPALHLCSLDPSMRGHASIRNLSRFDHDARRGAIVCTIKEVRRGTPRTEVCKLFLQVSSARWRAICAAQDKLDVTRIYSGKYRAVKSSSQHPRRSICVRMQSAQWKNVICRVTIHWAALGKDTTALSPIIRTIFYLAVPLPASNTSSSCR